MAHYVVCPQKKNNLPHFQNQRCINSYSVHMCNESYSHSYRLPARHPSPYKACIFENPNIYAESDLMYVKVVVVQYEPNIVKGTVERESFLVHSVSSCLDRTYPKVFGIWPANNPGRARFSTFGAIGEFAYFYSAPSPTNIGFIL